MSIFILTTSTRTPAIFCSIWTVPFPGFSTACGTTAIDPCLVLQTSPGHLQAWIHVCASSLEPFIATAIARQLARLYGGDPASADWRHLGRLAGFTNQKPARRDLSRLAPWVKIVHARAGLAPQASALVESAMNCPPASVARRVLFGSDPSRPPVRFLMTPAEAIGFTTTAYADGRSPSVSHGPTGASWIFGSPGTCYRWAAHRSGGRHHPLRQSPFSPPARRSPRLPAPHPRSRRFPFSPLRGPV